MKKTIALIALVLVLALGMASVAGATLVGAVYHIEEGNLLVTIPAGYHALTRTIEEGDPALSHFGLTRDYAVSFLETNDLYLDAGSDDSTKEITIAIQANKIDDLRNYSEVVLDSVRNVLSDTFANAGMEISKSELYSNDSASFIKIYYFDTNVKAYVLQYYTVYNYQTMNFRMYNRVGEITAAQEQIMKYMVDTAFFNAP